MTVLPRRDLLAALGAALLAAPAAAQTAGMSRRPLFVAAYAGARTGADRIHLPPGVDAPRPRRRGIPTILRISEQGIARVGIDAPIHIPQATPDGRSLVAAPMHGPDWALLDAGDLSLKAWGRSPEGFFGGGHAAFLRDGTVVTTERRFEDPSIPVGEREGRLALRDPRTLAVLAAFPSGGIRPHDVRILPDGRRAAVAHYGSYNPGGGRGFARDVPEVVAAGVAIVDLRTGRREAFLAGPTPHAEVRHLDLLGARLVAGQVREVAPDHPEAAAAPPYVQDTARTRFVSAPLVQADLAARVPALAPIAGTDAAVHALSVLADATHHEILVALAARNAIAVVGQDGRLRRIVDVGAHGCISPSGLGHVSPRHYAVAGHLQGVFVLERGTHRFVPEMSAPDIDVGGHSHLSAAP